MKLGRLIELLKEIDPAKVVANGFGMARDESTKAIAPCENFSPLTRCRWRRR